MLKIKTLPRGQDGRFGRFTDVVQEKKGHLNGEESWIYEKKTPKTSRIEEVASRNSTH